MKFSDIIKEASDLLRSKGRITYRALKVEFDLDEEHLDILKDELLFSHPEIAERDGRGLVWNETGESNSTLSSQLPQSQAPASYTPSHLAERIRAEQAAMEARGRADGERKTITALFADLKGSTALIEGLDPEEARALIDPALQLMMDAVHRYDGYVAQALGDGIFALFGAPLAHEDHPQRALYAALRMQEEMRAYSDQSRLTGGIPLQMRVGINTGEVVVRSIHKDDLHTDYVPVGHSTNLAARMEQMANPGSIVISEYTRKLTEGYFELKALGAADIKGVEEPLHVYEVLGAGPLKTRLQVAARRGLTRFVGRQSELDQMNRALEQAKAGHGQIVGVMGEPGLGKSRLFYEFKLTTQRGCLVLEALSVSHGKASPYLPLVELLKHYFQIEPTDDERTRKEKVNGKVITLDRSLEDIVPYLFSLLGIDDPGSSLQQMDAQIRRQRTFDALKKLFLRESLNQPLLLIFEDLHWIDSETQGFLDTLSESIASANLLLLVNYRPEYRHDWGQKTYYTQLRLAPLGQAEADELLTFLLGTDASLPALKSLILEKTEGTPFFMEEVAQTLVEEGALLGERGNYRLETTPTELQLSPTVQGVLAARIDRLLPEEKALLQQIAVIGRQLPVSLIKEVVPQSDAELYRVLASLQAKEFLYEQPAFPEVEYFFKHALTQDVAYGTVLQEQRKALHGRTAQAIEALYRDTLEEHYSELAHHYRLGGNVDKAVEFLHLAGQQAVQRSVHAEAVSHLMTALGLLETVPETPERTQHELRVHVALGIPLKATKGMAAPEVESVYRRARELCQQVGETAHLFPVLWSLEQFYELRADFGTARELGEQLSCLAQQAQDPAFLLEAYTARGTNAFSRGEFVLAREHLERGIDLYDSPQHHSLAFQYGLDPGVFCLSWAALTLWALGYPTQALKRSREAFSLARDLSHPSSSAAALDLAAELHQFRREGRAAQERAEAAVTLSNDHGFTQWLAFSTFLQGWGLVEQGQREEGLAQMQQSWTAWQATGAQNGRPYFPTLLADAYGKVGQTEEGLALLAEIPATVDKSSERFYEAELYRVQGELLLNDERGTRNDERQKKTTTLPSLRPSSFILHRCEEAETCFQQALDVARRQQAKSFELRAATSLARLWQQQGKTTEARTLLAPVYNWFTEGFDTADLKDAKALLATLSEGK